MSNSVRKSVALAFAALFGLSQGGAAQESKKPDGPNSAKIEGEKPKADAKSKGVANLRMAADLVAYGRESKSPEALILAAKILAATPVKTEGGSAKLAEGPAKPAEASTSTESQDVDPGKLLSEAESMTDDEHVVAQIADVRKLVGERSKGEIDGPTVRQGFVGPNGVVVWTGVFVAGQLASVTIAGYGGADFDLYVFDDRGNPIARDTGPGINATCTWRPIYTATFTMRVVNCSPFGSQYRYISN